MNKVAIIGAGRLGTHLGYALSTKDYHIISASCQSLSSAKKSIKIIGEGVPFTDNKRAAKNAEIIILCVPDDQIKDVVTELSSLSFQNKFVFHCSGLLSSQILDPLQKTGALTASIHPVQSFPKKGRRTDLFHHIYFGVEGMETAQKTARKMVKQLGGHSFMLQPDKKPLYHTACTLASNHFVVLLEMAGHLLRKTEIDKNLQNKILLPLVEGTLRNIEKNTLSGSLTGPVSRGDLETLKSNLKSLQKHPSILKIYKALSLQALNLADKEERLPKKKINRMRDLLE
ncbi:MAG: DUF2520 domain-containing protein [Candidatus Aminicenantes bacterium]|nr:DUF2520 domain-containing protein [Candidatus Aminicenantes bacterium]